MPINLKSRFDKWTLYSREELEERFKEGDVTLYTIPTLNKYGLRATRSGFYLGKSILLAIERFHDSYFKRPGSIVEEPVGGLIPESWANVPRSSGNDWRVEAQRKRREQRRAKEQKKSLVE
jgi:hypothetical protein